MPTAKAFIPAMVVPYISLFEDRQRAALVMLSTEDLEAFTSVLRCAVSYG
jgi:hypothetical protein